MSRLTYRGDSEAAQAYAKRAEKAEAARPSRRRRRRRCAKKASVSPCLLYTSHNQLTQETLYHKPQPIIWRCINCGYSYVAEKPYAKCPVCQKEAGWAEGDIDKKQLPSKQQKMEKNRER